MADDVLTFDELRQVQSGERDSDTLQELEEEFFDRARNYLALKREGDGHLQNQEYRNAKNILQDVLDLRQKKIVKLAFLSVKSNVDVDNLLPHEEELFEELENAIGAYRHDRHEEVFKHLDGESPGDRVEDVEEDGEQEDGEPDDVESGEQEEPEGAEEEAEEEPEEIEDADGEEREETADEEAEDKAGEPEDAGAEEIEDVPDEGEREEEEDKDSGGSSVDDILEFDRDENGQEDDGSEGETGTVEGEEESAGEQESESETSLREVSSSSSSESELRRSDSDEGKVLVRAQERVPEFMGTDLNAYGPFEEGEEAEVPEQNAEVLEEQGKAERV